PFRAPKLARAYEDERRQFQRERGYGLSGITLYGSEELADPRRLGDRRKIARLDRRQSVFKVRRDVVLSAASSHRVSKHPPSKRTYPVRGLVRPTCLDASQRCQQFLSSNGRDRTTPDIRVQEALEACSQDLHRLRRQ